MRNVVLLVSFLAQPAIAADKPISPAQFEALVTGQTLSYADKSTEYGMEEYFEGRRVRWSFLDGECAEGRWYAAGDQVCFVYEGVQTPQCWSFYLRDETLMAQFENTPGTGEIYETRRKDEPLQCLGPEVGA